jgi:hypothetical protein
VDAADVSLDAKATLTNVPLLSHVQSLREGEPAPLHWIGIARGDSRVGISDAGLAIVRLATCVGTAATVFDDAYKPARKSQSSDGMSLVRRASQGAAEDPGGLAS